ncbi:MAG: FecR domain-containing protein [Alphaproteobacteria bacterium]|nr:FecR domain-containing protein [Alphaproteobacteria bacterium]
MDVRSELQKLPPPDPAGEARVWAKYRESRAQPARVRWVVPALGLGLLAAAAAIAVLPRLGDAPRTVAIDDGAAAEQWSDVVHLETEGRGEARGTDRDLEIAWESGTITAHVTPNTGTHLAVVTDEARVEVVGTVFSVTRDKLGVRTSVAKGRVKVECTSGESGYVTPEDGERTCLPVRPALLLARADALTDLGADSATVLDTLDRGVAAATPGSLVHGELLVRRMHARGDAGRIDEALADAGAYLGSSETPRAVEVRRYAAWTAMASRGCAVALPHLEPLEKAGNDADRVLLAECVAAPDPTRARALLERALAGSLDETWAERARTDLRALEGR